MSTFAIIIASHGTNNWRLIARDRALPSAETQGADEIFIHHEPDACRAEVRNMLAAQAKSDWLVFLDADDQLDPGYINAFRAAVQGREKERLLLAPATIYQYGKRRKPAKYWPECDLRSGNWLVVGTGVQRKLFNKVGGWKHLTGTGVTNEYDDWHLWIRCYQAGATPVKVPDAVYVAHAMRTSKHRLANHALRVAWHKEVSDELWPAA